MRDALKVGAVLLVVAAMLAAAALPRRTYHGAQVMGVSGDCVTLLSAGELHTLCGGGR